MAPSKKAAEEFVKRWTGKGNEEQDKHLYWIGLFQDVLGLSDALDRLKFEQPVHTKASDHQGFIDAVFRTRVPMPAKRQKETFGQVLEQSLEKENSFQVIQSVHEQLSERITLHKESKDPDPLLLSVDELGEILERSGGGQEEISRFRKHCEEEFGADALLAPANLTSPKRMDIESNEIKISLDPKLSCLVETREIDGRKYILIPADSGVELNGIPVSIGK